MSIRDINVAIESISDAVSDMKGINFDCPAEPSESAEQEAWRDYGRDVADLLADAEKAVHRACDRIEI
jgi:hypothetical protein